MKAHAVDEWPVGDHLITGRRVKQPTTLAERMAEARHFAQRFNLTWPLAVDSPELGDPFLRAYAPWPTRFYVVSPGGRMEYIAQPNSQHTFDLAEVARALEAAVARHTASSTTSIGVGAGAGADLSSAV